MLVVEGGGGGDWDSLLSVLVSEKLSLLYLGESVAVLELENLPNPLYKGHCSLNSEEAHPISQTRLSTWRGLTRSTGVFTVVKQQCTLTGKEGFRRSAAASYVQNMT